MTQSKYDQGIELARTDTERRKDYQALVDLMTSIDLRLTMLTDTVKLAPKHSCRFSEDEAKAMHRFAQTIANGGWDKFNAVLGFGEALITARKTGTIALITAFVSGLVAILWLGLKHQLVEQQ